MAHAEEHDIIVILDAGAQYGKVIDRRIREMAVNTIMLPLDTKKEDFPPRTKGIVISGGPGSVNDGTFFDKSILTDPICPVLGICYGMQALSKAFAVPVDAPAVRQDGIVNVQILPPTGPDAATDLFASIRPDAITPFTTPVLLTHGDAVALANIAPPLLATAVADGDIVVGVRHESLPLYGVQFHPEVDASARGLEMIEQFVLRICAAGATFSVGCRQDMAIAELRATVGTAKVLVLASGGVDSTVTAALVAKAVGPDRMVCLHVDNGFMREDESARVVAALDDVGVQCDVVDAAETFANARTCDGLTVSTTTDPEAKRHAIGDTFIRVALAAVMERKLHVGLPRSVIRAIAAMAGGVESDSAAIREAAAAVAEVTADEAEESAAAAGGALSGFIIAQGTLRPDLIESASESVSTRAVTIKTHHNDSPLARVLRAAGRVAEPLRDLHKDEVRAMGRDLGVPEAMVMRQPFPGPGLSIRLLCASGAWSDDDGAKFAAAVDQLRAAVGEILGTRSAAATDDVASSADGAATGAGARVRASDSVLREIAAVHAATPLTLTLLPLRTVGVQGDGRTYAYAVAISGVWGKDGSAGVPWPALFHFAQLITAVVKSVNRVVVVCGAPPSGSAVGGVDGVWGVTKSYLQQGALAQLRAADANVGAVLLEHGLTQSLSQVPVVLLPIDFDAGNGTAGNAWTVRDDGVRSIVLRPFITRDFMTGRSAVPGVDVPHVAVDECVAAALVSNISRVVYDVTAKPPGTTEWE